jgi:hypothetical protein
MADYSETLKNVQAIPCLFPEQNDDLKTVIFKKNV